MAETRYPKFVVYILPIDDTTHPAWAKLTGNTIQNLLGCAIKILEPEKEMPLCKINSGSTTAYDAREIIAFIREKMPDDGSRIVGITCTALFDPVHNSTIAGMAEKNPPAAASAVISLLAAMNSIPAKPNQEHLELFIRRLRKIILHEIGHTFIADYKHCQNPGCVMRAGSRTEDAIDLLGNDYCGNCRKNLEDELRNENEYFECRGQTILSYLKKLFKK